MMPGGNTRSIIHVPPFPLTIVRAEGARITDADGHEYVDFLGEYTAGLYGHSHPVILERSAALWTTASCSARRTATSCSSHEAICARFPSVELVRFCNSGTEANLLALSLARVATGKPAVMVFEGGYHGGVFFFATADGSPINAPFPFVVGRYNDAESAAALIAEQRGRARRRDRRAASGRRPARFPASRRFSKRCASRPRRMTCCSCSTR